MSSKSELQSTTATLPLDQLRIDDKANVRRIGRGATAAFVGSIRTHGIKQPLIVRPNGKGYVVTDGGKRLEAAQELVKRGEWQPDAAVPVTIIAVSDAEARDISTTLNVIRETIHPVDEYRAFATLHGDKIAPLSVAEIAGRYGLNEKHVEQRLALGRLDETILTAWHRGEINVETAQAFTLSPTKKDQAALYAKLAKHGRVDAYDVKEALKVGNVGRLLNAVGIEAYEQRGGKVTRDLFGHDHVISDEALLKTMLDEKLAQVCKELVEQEGWAWATVEVPNDAWRYGHSEATFKPTRDEKKKLAELKAKCDDDALSFEENEAASEAHDALRAEILARAITPRMKAKAGCFVRVGQNGDIQIERGLIKPEPESERKEKYDARAGKMVPVKKKTANTMSGALIDALNEQRRKAIKAALLTEKQSELGALLARIVSAQIRPESRWGSAPQEVVRSYDTIANTISPKVMNAALRKTFDAKDFFARAPKAVTLAAITEAVNADEARKLANKKRAEIAAFATANVTKTGWLPKELRTAHYDGPAQKVKKAAKPKSNKKR